MEVISIYTDDLQSNKIKKFLAKENIDFESQIVEDPYELDSQTLAHIHRGKEDAKNGRVTPSSEVMKKMKALCNEA